MIFRDLVEDLDENIDPNTVFNWFHPSVSKNDAVDMLVKSTFFELKKKPIVFNSNTLNTFV